MKSMEFENTQKQLKNNIHTTLCGLAFTFGSGTIFANALVSDFSYASNTTLANNERERE